MAGKRVVRSVVVIAVAIAVAAGSATVAVAQTDVPSGRARRRILRSRSASSAAVHARTRQRLARSVAGAAGTGGAASRAADASGVGILYDLEGQWYQGDEVLASAGTLMFATLTHSPSAEIGMDLYGPPPDEPYYITSNAWGPATEQFVFEAPTHGPFSLVGYIDYAGAVPGSYTYTWNVTDLATDTGASDVIPYAPGEAMQSLGMEPGDTADSYTMTLGPGEMWFYLNQGTTLNGSMILVGPDETITSRAYSANLAYINPTITTHGVYTVTVSAPDGRQGRYDMFAVYASAMGAWYPTSARKITYGDRVHFNGTTSVSGPYAANAHIDSPAQVSSESGDYDSASGWVRATTQTGIGYFDVAPKIPANGRYQAWWIADSDHDSAWGPFRRIWVRAKLALSLSRSRVRAGTSVSITTKVYPGHTGKIVELYTKRPGGTWGRPVSRNRLRSGSVYTWKMSFRPGTRYFRAKFPGDSSHLANYSPVRTLAVTR